MHKWSIYIFIQVMVSNNLLRTCTSKRFPIIVDKSVSRTEEENNQLHMIMSNKSRNNYMLTFLN